MNIKPPIVPVTKTFLPPIGEYMAQVQRAYDKAWLTNRGELVQELESKLKVYLDVPNILITNNGTIPLQIALKLLANGGEVITTPFSYVATTAAIVWENCTPVFVDIHPEYLTIDETKIEAAITPRTTCILATHVFGNPCQVEAIQEIADRHGLAVIYDAAHCFGVRYKGKNIFEYGDVSTCSFHATKLFHTGEGGAVFSPNKDLMFKFFYSHAFGHLGPIDYYGVGINGKQSELHAAMGLSVLPYMNHILEERKNAVEYYNQLLSDSILDSIHIRPETQWNFSYYPLLFPDENTTIKIEAQLKNNQILPRRYFYPSLNTIRYTGGTSLTISEDIASRILCLPLYVGIEKSDIEKVVKIILKSL